MRLYDKTSEHVRLELILRPDFLRKAGITELRDIGRLARFDFSPYIRFRGFRKSARQWSSFGKTSGRNVRIQDQVRIIRKELKLNPESLLIRAAISDLLDSMQSRLIW